MRKLEINEVESTQLTAVMLCLDSKNGRGKIEPQIGRQVGLLCLDSKNGRGKIDG